MPPGTSVNNEPDPPSMFNSLIAAAAQVRAEATRSYQLDLLRNTQNLWTTSMNNDLFRIAEAPVFFSELHPPVTAQETWNNQGQSTVGISINSLQENIANLFGTPNEGEEEQGMDSTETMVKALFSHEVSAGGRQFLSRSLILKKFPESFCTAVFVEGSSYGRRPGRLPAIEAGTRLLKMGFDGVLVYDERIHFYLTSRGVSLLVESLRKYFMELSREPIEGTRGHDLCTLRLKNLSGRSLGNSESSRFSDFLSRKFGAERI